MDIVWLNQILFDLGGSIGDFANGAQVIIDQFISSAKENGQEHLVWFYCCPMDMRVKVPNTLRLD